MRETTTADCRHGKFTFFTQDEFVGLSLARYGEYSEREVDVFRKVLRQGDVALDIGANIGALTVPMSRMVGEAGKVYAFEASTENAQLLRRNLAANGCTNVTVIEAAVGGSYGYGKVQSLASLEHHNYGRVETGVGDRNIARMPIDGLELEQLRFAKIDVEGHERDVLLGMKSTIERLRPILYVENDRQEKSEALVAALIDMQYRMFWHRPPLFDDANYRSEERNVFGHIVSQNMVSVPEERGIQVTALDEVADIRQDDRMFDREIERYTRYVERDNNDLSARLVIAHYQGLMQRHDEMEALLSENLRRDPDDIPTKAIVGLRKLQQGNWKEGWPAYELRFYQKNLHYFGGHRKHDVPQWNGEPTLEPVLIWNEQGFGDSIMFARFFKHVLKRAPNAILEVQPELYELFEQSHVAQRPTTDLALDAAQVAIIRDSWNEQLRGSTPILSAGSKPQALYRLGRTLPPYALHCSLPSTPAALGADEAMMRSEPYLRADPALTQRWRHKHAPRIGICTQGSPRSERPYTRDIPDKLFDQIVRRHGPLLSLTGSQFESFADTAAAIASLDLVLTVDTSVAHLAGALGKETWLMLATDSDFRWGDGEDQVWYPSMRVFKQRKFRDWAGVIDRIGAALDDKEIVKLEAAS